MITASDQMDMMKRRMTTQRASQPILPQRPMTLKLTWASSKYIAREAGT
jgi:hypothetical protein